MSQLLSARATITDLDNQGTALSVQEASQRFASVTLSLLGHAGIRCPIEPVIRPRVHVKLDWNSRTAQAFHIRHVFFEEEIKTADRYIGWRQARHIRCP